MRRLFIAVFILGGVTIASAADCKVDKRQYQALQNGMSYEQAVKILGCEGEELSSSDVAGFSTVMYMWKGSGIVANMNAMFQNDEMVSKAQFGLK